MNVETLSRAELLTLLSILEGELEAQDVVIHALRVSLYSAGQASRPSQANVASNAQYNLHIECPAGAGVGGCGRVNRKLRKQQGCRDKAGLESRPLFKSAFQNQFRPVDWDTRFKPGNQRLH